MVVGTYRPVDVILGDHPLKAVKRELQAHGLCRELPLEYLTEEEVGRYLAITLPVIGFRSGCPVCSPSHRRQSVFMVNLVDYLVPSG